jgi:hypothetical protein
VNSGFSAGHKMKGNTMKGFILSMAAAATLLVGTLVTPNTAEARWGYRGGFGRGYYGNYYRPYYGRYNYYRPYYGGYGYGYPGYYSYGYGYPGYGYGYGGFRSGVYIY